MLLYIENLRALAAQSAISDNATCSDNVSVAVAGANVSIIVADSAIGTDSTAISQAQLGGLLPFQMRQWPKAENKTPAKSVAPVKQGINTYEQSVNELVVNYKLEELTQGSIDGAIAKENVSVLVENSQNDSAQLSETLEVSTASTWLDSAIAIDNVAISIDLANVLTELAQGSDEIEITTQLAPYVLQMHSLILNGFI